MCSARGAAYPLLAPCESIMHSLRRAGPRPLLLRTCMCTWAGSPALHSAADVGVHPPASSSHCVGFRGSPANAPEGPEARAKTALARMGTEGSRSERHPSSSDHCYGIEFGEREFCFSILVHALMSPYLRVFLFYVSVRGVSFSIYSPTPLLGTLQREAIILKFPDSFLEAFRPAMCERTSWEL